VSPRLIVFGGSADQAHAATLAAARPGWQRIAFGDAQLLTGPQTACLQAGDDLVLVGQPFDRRARPLIALAPGVASAIIGSDGRWLADHLWGRYIAIWRDRLGRGIRLYRDPGGMFPLFRQQDRALAFSDLDDALSAGSTRPRVDWTNLAHRLCFSERPTRATCLEGIEEVLPGEIAGLSGPPSTELLWSPWSFAGDPAEPDFERASRAVREAVSQSVAAFAAPCAPILLELSGGLDSSIIAACLGDTGAAWSALTIATPGGGGDERIYARAVAGHCHASLAELAVETVDLTAPPQRRLPYPGGYSALQTLDRAIAAHADQIGAAALFSGTGGDNVFCSVRSPAPVLDALRRAGLRQALRTASDLESLASATRWDLLRHTHRYARKHRQGLARWPATPDLLDRDCRPALAPHPWLNGPVDFLAGSRAHIVMLLRAHSVMAAHDRSRTHDMIFPLLAQPVLEACLACPSWLWIRGGRDRAVARAAFGDRLPAQVRNRRGKGSLESLLAPAFDRARESLKSFLLDGELAARGMIDRDAVAHAFASGATTSGRYMRLLDLVDAESWLSALRGSGAGERAPAPDPARI
jgi:asparagine synthase (glutamine-hydrolysing)